jgi:aquaporin Z
MNPAVTLTYLRLGRMRGRDALGYIAAQFAGGTLGVLAVATVLGRALADPPVHYVVTQPGAGGTLPAALGEFLISALMMLVVLAVSSRPRWARCTGLVAGVLVAAFITFEAPLSGMSMNPARSFASAWPAGDWHAFWIYLAVPVAGMQFGAAAYPWLFRRRPTTCAKLVHGTTQRCIHCGYEPPMSDGARS